MLLLLWSLPTLQFCDNDYVPARWCGLLVLIHFFLNQFIPWNLKKRKEILVWCSCMILQYRVSFSAQISLLQNLFLLTGLCYWFKLLRDIRQQGDPFLCCLRMTGLCIIMHWEDCRFGFIYVCNLYPHFLPILESQVSTSRWFIVLSIFSLQLNVWFCCKCLWKSPLFCLLSPVLEASSWLLVPLNFPSSPALPHLFSPINLTLFCSQEPSNLVLQQNLPYP